MQIYMHIYMHTLTWICDVAFEVNLVYFDEPLDQSCIVFALLCGSWLMSCLTMTHSDWRDCVNCGIHQCFVGLLLVGVVFLSMLAVSCLIGFFGLSTVLHAVLHMCVLCTFCLWVSDRYQVSLSPSQTTACNHFGPKSPQSPVTSLWPIVLINHRI